jgi:hypothetical protein
MVYADRLTMKWSKRIAQGFSPGYLWHKMRPESGARGECVQAIPALTPRFARISDAAFRALSLTNYLRAKALGYSLRPFHGQAAKSLAVLLNAVRYSASSRTRDPAVQTMGSDFPALHGSFAKYSATGIIVFFRREIV